MWEIWISDSKSHTQCGKPLSPGVGEAARETDGGAADSGLPLQVHVPSECNAGDLVQYLDRFLLSFFFLYVGKGM